MRKENVDIEYTSLEIWKVVPNWDQYEVSNFGRIRRKEGFDNSGHYRKEKYLSTSISNKAGRVCVCLSDLPYRIEKLDLSIVILRTFIGPCPDGYHACHRDDKPSNNNLYNLYWGTPKENCCDRVRNGTQVRGERCHTAKLTETDVRVIRTAYKPKRGQGSYILAKKYGVSPVMIMNIIKNKSWSHIQ